jgi:cytochrome c oxidase subunit I+III
VIFLGFNITFMPMYVVGILGMPRRVYTYDAGLGWEPYNLVSSLGGMVIATGIIILLYNFISSLRKGAVSGGDPWDAWTLEWATTSPPPVYNFESVPVVRGPRPLWDLKHPDQADYLESGREEVELPAKTSAPEIQEHHGAPLTSSIPLLAAIGVVAVAAGGLGAPIIPVIGGVFLLGTLVAWAWQPWEETLYPHGTTRPGGVVGTWLFIGSEAVFFASLFYTYIHLRMRTGMWPPEGMPALEAGLPAINTVILLTSGLFAHWGYTGLVKRRRGRFTFGVGAAVVLGAVFIALQGVEWSRAGFGLSDGVLGSVFFTLTGFHGAHVTAGVILLVIAGVRARRGNWKGEATNAEVGLVESGTYYWHFVDAVWIILFLLIYVWPASSGGGGAGM